MEFFTFLSIFQMSSAAELLYVGKSLVTSHKSGTLHSEVTVKKKREGNKAPVRCKQRLARCYKRVYNCFA